MRSLRDIKLAGAIFVVLALAMFPPCLCIAGSLEPSDLPGPTMHTLDELYTKPVWKMSDRIFVDWAANPRFAVCDNGTTETRDDMVLDKDTGLIWERMPLSNRNAWEYSWSHALYLCRIDTAGDRHGWRLPTIEELGSLADWSHFPPALPLGHPFIVKWDSDGPDIPRYWSATTHAYDPNYAYVEQFYSASIDAVAKSQARHFWCVWGGQGVVSQ